MDKEKQEMLSWPRPQNLKELRGFSGLTGYYRRFIQWYAQATFPLTCLLKKDRFEWNEAATEAFEKLKRTMTTTPVLEMPDFSQPFVLEADASGHGLGAVLSQMDHPIAFFSKMLGPKGRCKSIERAHGYCVGSAKVETLSPRSDFYQLDQPKEFKIHHETEDGGCGLSDMDE